MSARLERASRTARSTQRIAGVLELFPELAEHRRQIGEQPVRRPAADARARRACCIHEPEVLLIDELSLGLAPVVVQRLLEVVEELKARGQTMIIVEQSLNVALAVADRAVFLEKGEVRFEGPPRSCSSATTSPAPCSSGPRAADARSPRSSRGTWSSTASSAA